MWVNQGLLQGILQGILSRILSGFFQDSFRILSGIFQESWSISTGANSDGLIRGSLRDASGDARDGQGCWRETAINRILIVNISDEWTHQLRLWGGRRRGRRRRRMGGCGPHSSFVYQSEVSWPTCGCIPPEPDESHRSVRGPLSPPPLPPPPPPISYPHHL